MTARRRSEQGDLRDTRAVHAVDCFRVSLFLKPLALYLLFKTYCRKHQPPHFRAPHHSFLGVRQAAGLSRSIFLGAIERIVPIHPAPRAQKGYLRISLTRFASCIAQTSPAITAAQRVRSACAPGSWANSVKLWPYTFAITGNTTDRYIR